MNAGNPGNSDVTSNNNAPGDRRYRGSISAENLRTEGQRVKETNLRDRDNERKGLATAGDNQTLWEKMLARMRQRHMEYQKGDKDKDIKGAEERNKELNDFLKSQEVQKIKESAGNDAISQFLALMRILLLANEKGFRYDWKQKAEMVKEVGRRGILGAAYVVDKAGEWGGYLGQQCKKLYQAFQSGDAEKANQAIDEGVDKSIEMVEFKKDNFGQHDENALTDAFYGGPDDDETLTHG